MKITKWRDVKAELLPERLEEIERGAEVMSASIELDWLRRAREISGDDWLDALDKARGRGRKTAGDFDPRVSSLREVVEAMGGELRITAHFPDAEYRIDGFEGAEQAEEPSDADAAA